MALSVTGALSPGLIGLRYRLDLRKGARPPQQEPLGHIAIESSQHVELTGRLDPFGDHLHAEAVPHPDDVGCDGSTRTTVGDTPIQPRG